MAELDTSASNQPPDPPPGQEIDPSKLDSTNSYRRGDAPDLTALTRPPANLTGNLADLQKRKMGAEAAIDAQTTARMEQDRARMEKAFQEEGVGPDTIKPWNATEEHRKFETSPLESFGSVASVFAILASAFTHAPMENALNGSAAAMNAIRAGDENAYQRNFEAFKVNMDLAQKRFNMQHQLYSDALGLMQTDATLGRMKLENAARQFGDQKTLSLLEAGMDKELIDLINSRQKTAMQAFELNEKITDATLRKGVFESLQKQIPDMPGKPGQKDPMAVMRAWNVAHGIHEPVDQQLITKYLVDHPDATPEEVAAYAQKIRTTRVSSNSGIHVEAEYVQNRVRELAEQRPELSQADRLAQAEREWSQVKKSGITGNQKERLEAHAAQYDEALKTVDSITGVLDRYAGAAGVAGKVTRLGERIGNIGGSNSTDRVQMMRDIELLQTLAPRLFLDAHGRPLSSEAGKINDIVAGLNAGDTTANTLRAMKEIKERLTRMRDAQVKRIGDKPAPAPAAEPPKEAPRSKWMDAPVVGPRSEAEPAEATV